MSLDSILDVGHRQYQMQQNGEKKLKRMDIAIRASAIIALALFALTIVLIGLTQAGFIHPVAGLGSFCAILPMLVIMKVIDCCRDSVAKSHGIALDEYDSIQLRKSPRQRRDSGSEQR